MIETTIGDARVNYNDRELTLTVKESGCTLTFDGPKLSELSQFINQCMLRQESRRRAVRVPVGAHAGLVASVQIDGQSHLATVVEISLIGIGLRMSENSVFELNEDDVVQLSLSIDKNELAYDLTGRVVNSSSDRLRGICFDGVFNRKGEVDPPDQLQEIFAKLRKRWLIEITS